jgi:CheY-like chemotaxis protein
MKLPVLSHPTTTVLVDDSDSFLQSVVFQLDPGLASKTFHDTTEALNWFHASARRCELPLEVNVDVLNLPSDQRNVAVDVRRIVNVSSQRQRFSIPSVLVVDYSMPQMNGVEFCEALQGIPCKKILFTGAADEKIAVDAFNRGLIDRYISKSAEDALDRLEREIEDMQRAFFFQHSETLCELLSLHDYGFLRCQAMAAVIQNLRKEHALVEHYLFHGPTGVLFFDRYGKAKMMVIETGKSMCSHYEIARDNDAPPSLLEALRERRVVPFFSQPGADGMYSAAVGEQWHRYCAPPQVCQGRETWYWALFNVPDHYLTSPVYAFNEFLSGERQASRSV